MDDVFNRRGSPPDGSRNFREGRLDKSIMGG